jgi:xanthosine utilization system XapX-like protein
MSHSPTSRSLLSNSNGISVGIIISLVIVAGPA